ncbi:adenosylcobinamide amidohydrolase [Streptomyces pinistramenti]|uniref:adenosylcobinamide amidohydrolase n=1 Tax=Streptomyces pinistramenti TaxID=2884812 RepID=UPI001D092FD5|nr:adenosylcobinamide amidohydrolase [Streptomyces pinistramenti]MCB5906194.1 adenosylcobinamide amidohydrolase [Streptomyces pinistramenti]
MDIELRDLLGSTSVVWLPGSGWRMLSSGVLGGGLGPRTWVLNAQVPLTYDRTDPAVHLTELRSACGLSGDGVGMLTATAVRHYVPACEQGVEVTATVGLSVPTWAADHAAVPSPMRPGTVNIIASLPVPLDDAALVNAVITATEAKTQALWNAGLAGTGTASDALCVAVPESGGPSVPFCGPRSVWGMRLARAVHTAVYRGAVNWLKRHPQHEVARSTQAPA